MEIPISETEARICKEIAETAQKLNIEAYLVGGFVRDKLINRICKDIDVVSIGQDSGIKLAEALAKANNTNASVFKNFGTAMIQIHGFELEFVGARKESYQRDSRKPIVEEGTIEDDQNRRDFTINALAVSLNSEDYGTLIDPFGGIEHLENHVIKTPLEPEITFSDDPLRIMRAIRFASQLQFKIQPQTWRAIKSVAHRIEIISKERIADELNKIILSPKPSIGLNLLFEAGLLEYIFPELLALHGVEYKNGRGHKDNFYHTLQVVDNLAQNTNDLWLRWSAVLHDIAKPPTKRFHEKAGWTFHGHEALGAKMVPKIFKKMKLPLNEKMRYVQKLVELHLRPIALSKKDVTDSAVRRLIMEAGEYVDDLMLLCEADITTKNKEKFKRYLENFKIVRDKVKEVDQKDALRTWKPPIDGDIIMQTFGIKPSRPVGELKNTLKQLILEGKVENDFNAAFQKMLELAKERYDLIPISEQTKP